jgi:zinc/manganese transport system permease protein
MRTGTTMANTMFTYDFMQNAFAAAGIVAVVCGLVGFFLVLRAQTFAGHALSHVGFAGATGAVLVGIAPLWGLVALTLLAGIGMGLLGERLHQRDVAIGIVLAMSLGLGLLFLHFFTAYATQATALLFGNILGVDATRYGRCCCLVRRRRRHSPPSRGRCCSPACSPNSPRRRVYRCV